MCDVCDVVNVCDVLLLFNVCDMCDVRDVRDVVNLCHQLGGMFAFTLSGVPSPVVPKDLRTDIFYRIKILMFFAHFSGPSLVKLNGVKPQALFSAVNTNNPRAYLFWCKQKQTKNQNKTNRIWMQHSRTVQKIN
jgi:hypothetical protein